MRAVRAFRYNLPPKTAKGFPLQSLSRVGSYCDMRSDCSMMVFRVQMESLETISLQENRQPTIRYAKTSFGAN